MINVKGIEWLEEEFNRLWEMYGRKRVLTPGNWQMVQYDFGDRPVVYIDFDVNATPPNYRRSGPMMEMKR